MIEINIAKTGNPVTDSLIENTRLNMIQGVLERLEPIKDELIENNIVLTANIQDLNDLESGVKFLISDHCPPELAQKITELLGS